ncbi:flavodoxin domain-containing protein [Rhodococcus sp. IEGM 1366]|uniref:flavodoxin domain-containing protein n=1 Tax=Rhodococcus sp. IEGM 1366 TaxID=3082223 RepID=UPI0029535848|nr:flavodoxin domain-containing protein [Rhodococcus sp. IEGM 1366]MDV8070618.1 flavodoxin domain-containing protein [Rhodococcus sp. IEGM 1366]
MTTLVSYATAKGSIRELVECIAAQLESLGETVYVLSLCAVTSVQEYDGSAIHSGQWLPEAADAIERLRPQLAGRSVWAYSVSSVREPDDPIEPGGVGVAVGGW